MPSRSDRDQLTRFLIEGAGVRGVLVHLTETWRQIRSHITGTGASPAAAAELLGEASAAAALFTAHAKVDGRLSVQLRGHGALRTLFAECTAAGTLRGIVQLAEDGTVSRDLRELGPDALLAITIENPAHDVREPMRYQSMVPLESHALAGAFEDYFRRSEQLPTRLLLAADEGSAAGLMLQKLPADAGDDDGWTRTGVLFDTLSPRELLDWPGETLLHRLFHEDGVRPLGGKPLRFDCSCSRARVEAMLLSLGVEEAQAALADGEVLVRCEFCGQSYRFSAAQVGQLFATGAAQAGPAPERLQ